MTAQEFIDGIEYPIVWFASVGSPTGQTIAVLNEFVSIASPTGQTIAVLNETEFPFDLSEIEGEVDSDGDFEASNLKVRDFDGNTVTKLQIYSDKEEWDSDNEEWNSID